MLFAEALLGASPVAYGAAVVPLYALMVGFFGAVVLPRVEFSRTRRRAVLRDWAISAAAYLVVLVTLVWGASVVLVG